MIARRRLDLREQDEKARERGQKDRQRQQDDYHRVAARFACARACSSAVSRIMQGCLKLGVNCRGRLP